MAGKHADQQGKSANRENKTGTLNQAAGLITNILRRPPTLGPKQPGSRSIPRLL